jgi:predicted DNA-binding protein with PD1-like motif
MEGLWYKECSKGRRFIIKITPGESLTTRLLQFAHVADVRYAMIVSALGSVKNVKLRGIKTGAKLPITPPRVTIHEIEGPLELLGLQGNIVPGESELLDCHFHIMLSKSSGEVVGGHLYDAEVFATCEIVLTELDVEGVERHVSKVGGIPTIYIDEGDE